MGTVVIYLGTGITAGASTFLESTLTYVSNRSRFQQYRASRDWRLVFTASSIAGAAIYALVYQGEPWAAAGSVWVTEVAPWRLFVGGIFVGVGTGSGKAVLRATESVEWALSPELRSWGWRHSYLSPSSPRISLPHWG